MVWSHPESIAFDPFGPLGGISLLLAQEILAALGDRAGQLRRRCIIVSITPNIHENASISDYND